ncbi:MAG: helix-turn-helix domain-containing protein [Gammaproteobacteria bacterium]
MTSNKPHDLAHLDSISKRLKYIIDTLGVKQSHMAEKMGLSPSGLHYILNNDVKFSKNAKKIAEYLKVNENWMIEGKGDVYEDADQVTGYKIPVYYLDQLKLFYNSNQNESIASNNFMLTTTQYSNKISGIYVTATNFVPKFEIGDIVAFEQIDTFKDGEIILVYLAKSNHIVIKYAFHAASEIILLSNTENPLKLDTGNSDIIIGVYRECLKKSN